MTVESFASLSIAIAAGPAFLAALTALGPPSLFARPTLP